MRMEGPGQIVIVNGPPRSGKTSIAAAIQETFPGVWMNLGVDGFKRMTPARLQPGIGLRPGGERPDLEPLIVTLYLAMYDSIAAHSRLGLSVVVDVAHHDAYSVPRGILPACARRLAGLPVLFVGVRCPIATVRARRVATWGGTGYVETEAGWDPVEAWQREVHAVGGYDLEVDTSVLSPAECAEAIRRRLVDGPPPSAFPRLAGAG
jgi:chloramphenicol 3-O phosphotransferase